jgi:hypothetical protein
MAKNKISEYSATAANNTDIGGINIAEGCAPSGINNAIRELMAQLKDQQVGTDGDNFTVGGAFTCTGAAVFSSTVALGGSATATTQSATDDSTKLATTAFVRDIIPTGVIVMWSGSIASIPSGWLICDGSNSTPDLRNRFIVGAGSTYSVAGTGGSADAVTVSHTHTATVTDSGHRHNTTLDGNVATTSSFQSQIGRTTYNTADGGYEGYYSRGVSDSTQANASTSSTATTGVSVSNSSTGSSGTNANLPPYYALAYIMKS